MGINEVNSRVQTNGVPVVNMGELKDTIYVQDTVFVAKSDTLRVPESIAKSDTIFPRKETKEERFERLARQNEANQIVSNMYEAIDGLGTDDALFEKALGEINEGNAYYVKDLWDNTLGKYYGETFYEAFEGDADKAQLAKFGEKLKELFKNAINPYNINKRAGQDEAILTEEQFKKL